MRWFFLIVLWPMAVFSEPLPALYSVVYVASDDRLNVRAAPSGSADLLGSLAHNTINIEVTALNDTGSWGRINMPETHGWVSMRYLTPQAVNEDYSLSQNLVCFGTEPFWSADITQGQRVTFRTPEESYETPGAGLIKSGRSRPDHFAMGFGDSTAIFRRATCSDGMSDQIFGISVDMYKIHGGDAALYSGCCSVMP